MPSSRRLRIGFIGAGFMTRFHLSALQYVRDADVTGIFAPPKAERDEAAQIAAGDIAIQGARALRHNDYKIPMMRNLVRRAVRSVA